jgi:hypothetical protein
MSNRAQIVVIITISMLLSACGGGADSLSVPATAIPAAQGDTLATTPVVAVDPAPSQPVAVDAAPSQPDVLAATTTTTLGDCFTLTPGVKFQKSDSNATWQIVDEPFQGRPAIGSVELRADGTRFGVQFYAVDAEFIHLLGDIDYFQSGELASVMTNSTTSRFPATMQPGDSFQFSATNTRVYVPMPPQTTSKTRTELETAAITYLGQETLLLAGHTFANVCKLRVQSSTVDTSNSSNNRYFLSNVWFAKGYGLYSGPTI